MFRSLRSWFGRYLVLLVLLLGLMLTPSCSGTPLSLLTGGGPNVAANTQLGKTNTQTIGTTQIVEQKINNPTADKIVQSTDTNSVRSDKVDTINISSTPISTVIIAVLWSLFLWELPAPRDIARGIRNMFRFRRK